MTTEELADLKLARDVKKGILKSLSHEMSILRTQLKSLSEKWEEFNKDYSLLDRKIAEATKVRVIASTYNPRPPQTMTSRTAKEFLEALGIPLEEDTEPSEEPPLEPGDVIEAISTLESLCEDGGGDSML